MTARVAAVPDGRPCWAEAVLPDAVAGRRFYGELFGWTFSAACTAVDGGAYTLALLDGMPAAGLCAKRDGRLPTVWNLYLSAADASAATAAVREAGGQILTEPGKAAGMAVRALAADPGGTVFGLWQPAGLTGFAVRDEPGAYAWSEVHTRDPKAVDAFYAEVFGYGAGDTEEAGLTLWAPEGEPADAEHAVGGRRVLGEDFPRELPPHFLTYFWVGDCAEAVGRTVRLGGRVLRPPEEGPYGKYAVLLDNQGARFAVREHAGGE